jgi:hypothetical protein
MQALENEDRAQQRGKIAQHVNKLERIEKDNKENAHIVARQAALEQEKIRAAYIAKLPKPIDELENIISNKPQKTVTLQTSNLFASTRYHMPDSLVDKSSPLENVKLE